MLKYIRGDIVKENKLIDLSMDFSVAVLNVVETIKGHSALVNQIERSSTSIGANIHEANYAQSKSDFVSKLQIALKETYETEYWLELFQKAGFLTEVTTKALLNQCGTIRRLLIASVNTAKNNK
ncbi:MAG: four helix bundle protein [Eubacterium sp.]|nr:four helix bundle protein [Eubacterium sp.]